MAAFSRNEVQLLVATTGDRSGRGRAQRQPDGDRTTPSAWAWRNTSCAAGWGGAAKATLLLFEARCLTTARRG